MQCSLVLPRVERLIQATTQARETMQSRPNEQHVNRV